MKRRPPCFSAARVPHKSLGSSCLGPACRRVTQASRKALPRRREGLFNHHTRFGGACVPPEGKSVTGRGNKAGLNAKNSSWQAHPAATLVLVAYRRWSGLLLLLLRHLSHSCRILLRHVRLLLHLSCPSTCGICRIRGGIHGAPYRVAPGRTLMAIELGRRYSRSVMHMLWRTWLTC